MKAKNVKRLATVWMLLAIVAAYAYDWRGLAPAFFAAGGFLLGALVLHVYAAWLEVDEMAGGYERLATEEEISRDPR